MCGISGKIGLKKESIKLLLDDRFRGNINNGAAYGVY